MCQTSVNDAREKEPPAAPTVTGAEPSRAASAGAVTEASDCDVPSVAALVATLSADPEAVALARAYVDASRARWRSMMRPPFNAEKDVDHWRLAARADDAWRDWCAALRARCIRSGDRRGLAVAVAGTREE